MAGSIGARELAPRHLRSSGRSSPPSSAGLEHEAGVLERQPQRERGVEQPPRSSACPSAARRACPSAPPSIASRNTRRVDADRARERDRLGRWPRSAPRIQWLSTSLSRVAAPGASPSQRVSRADRVEDRVDLRAHVGRARREHDELGLLGRLLGAQHGRVDVGRCRARRASAARRSVPFEPDRAHLRPHRARSRSVAAPAAATASASASMVTRRRRPSAASAGLATTSRRARPAAAPSRGVRFQARTSGRRRARLRAIGEAHDPGAEERDGGHGDRAYPCGERSYTASPMATGEHARDFPLFPLGIVALPSEFVPLHIFEDRYKTMIAECLDVGSRVRDRLALGRRACARSAAPARSPRCSSSSRTAA